MSVCGVGVTPCLWFSPPPAPEVVKELTARLEKQITEGRSTLGAPQKNDVPIDLWKKAKPEPEKPTVVAAEAAPEVVEELDTVEGAEETTESVEVAVEETTEAPAADEAPAEEPAAEEPAAEAADEAPAEEETK